MEQKLEEVVEEEGEEGDRFNLKKAMKSKPDTAAGKHLVLDRDSDSDSDTNSSDTTPAPEWLSLGHHRPSIAIAQGSVLFPTIRLARKRLGGEDDKLSAPQHSHYKSRHRDLRGSSSMSSKETSITKKFKSLKSKEKNLPKRKPLKICGVKERTRIGVAAATLKELRTKIQTQFPSSGDDFKIVLEEDCTRIEDEDYFKTLPDNTVLMVVSEGEQWTGASSSFEEEFSKGFIEVDGKMTQEETSHSQRLAQVAGRIAENPALLALLPKVDLEVMADANLNELQVLLHQTKEKTEFIQDACERRLLDVIESDKARELLKLYHRVKTKDGKSLAKTEEGGSLAKTEEGGSLAKTEKGGSLAKMEDSRDLLRQQARDQRRKWRRAKTEGVGSLKRVTRSTSKKSKET